MQPNYPQFQAGRYGVVPNTEAAPFPTVAGTSTTTINIGMTARRQIFGQGFVSQIAVIVPASGHVALVIGKYDSTNSNTQVPLTASINVDTSPGGVAKQTTAIPALSTLTDAQRTIHPADLIYAAFTTTGALTSQAVGGIVGVELYDVG